MPVEITTIKVPKSLRERITDEARRSGLTAAELIADLLEVRERQARFDAVRRAYATANEVYLRETEEWDALAGDGLRP